jgi:tRNA threonylcarbamoyl adenosine modification protein YjeE
MTARRWRCEDEAAMRALGASLAAELAPAGVLLLEGDLGAGKTVLAQGVASGLGVDPDDVQSPTFTLVREHQGRGPRGHRLVHADLYRLPPAQLGDLDDLDDLGMDELLSGPGVKIVEWAERLPRGFPGALRLRIGRLADGAREVVELGEIVETDAAPSGAAPLQSRHHTAQRG